MTGDPEDTGPRMDEVAAARQALGRLGAFLPATTAGDAPVQEQIDAARRLEGVGYRATWTNEVIGQDALVQLADGAPVRHAAYGPRHRGRQHLG